MKIDKDKNLRRDYTGLQNRRNKYKTAGFLSKQIPGYTRTGPQ
jgi:hypothetical protein